MRHQFRSIEILKALKRDARIIRLLFKQRGDTFSIFELFLHRGQIMSVK